MLKTKHTTYLKHDLLSTFSTRERRELPSDQRAPLPPPPPDWKYCTSLRTYNLHAPMLSLSVCDPLGEVAPRFLLAHAIIYSGQRRLCVEGFNASKPPREEIFGRSDPSSSRSSSSAQRGRCSRRVGQHSGVALGASAPRTVCSPLDPVKKISSYNPNQIPGMK